MVGIRMPENGDLICYEGKKFVIIYRKDVWFDWGGLKTYYFIKENEIGKLNKKIELEEILQQCKAARWGEFEGRDFKPFIVIEENKYKVDIETITTVKVE